MYLVRMDARQTLPPEPLLDTSQLATYLGVPVATIYDWRMRGIGPRAYRVGRHLRFSAADVAAWIEQRHDPEQRAR